MFSVQRGYQDEPLVTSCRWLASIRTLPAQQCHYDVLLHSAHDFRSIGGVWVGVQQHHIGRVAGCKAVTASGGRGCPRGMDNQGRLFLNTDAAREGARGEVGGWPDH